MRNKMWKKYQKGLNKLVRDLNKNIADDNLWRSRFVFHIMASEFEEFEDGSGGILYAIIRAYDKKDHFYKDYRIEYAPYLHSHNSLTIWRMGNKFITEDSFTYSPHNESPYDDTTDYYKIDVHPATWNLKINPYNLF